jgi:hypothetical protein
MRPVAILVLAATAAVALGTAVAPASRSSWPLVPAPEECLVAPRSPDDVRHLAGTPQSGGQADSALVADDLPTGQRADTSTVEATTAVVRELVACEAAGDRLRTLALYTDAYLTALPLLDPATIGGPPAGSPLATSRRASLLGVWDVRVLADARVRAFVAIGNRVDPDPLPGRTALFLFAQQGGRWRIDGVIEKIRATPVAQLAGTPPTGGWRPAASPGVGIGAWAVVIVVRDGAALHAAPDEGSTVIAVLPAGTELEVYGLTEEGAGGRWRPVVARLDADRLTDGYVTEDAIAVVVPPAVATPMS